MQKEIKVVCGVTGAQGVLEAKEQAEAKLGSHRR